MAAQDYAQLVQTLYVTYFGRPADYFGMDNFCKQLDAMKAPKTLAEVSKALLDDKAGTTALSKLVNSFNTAKEATDMYGTDTSALGVSKFVEAIYLHVLNRAPDTEGWQFWTNAITSGAQSRGTAAAAIADGALKNITPQGLLDAKTVTNKIAVASDFTSSLITIAQINGYSGDAAAATARDMLAKVDGATDTTAYHSTVVSTVDIIVAGSIPGKSFAFTTGQDTFVGTSGNDVFTATTAVVIDPATGNQFPTDTLQEFDSIDGGAGVDTLKIVTTIGGTIKLPMMKSVEIVEVSSLKDVTISTKGVDDVTNLNVIKAGGDVKATAGAATDVSVAMKAATIGAVEVSGGKNVTVNLTDVNNTTAINVGSALGATAAAGTVAVTATGAAIDAATATVNLAAITVKGGSSINVTQKATSNAAAVAGDSAMAHSVNQGAINITGNASTTTVTVKQDATQFGYEATKAVAGKASTQEISFTAMKAKETVTIDFGGGNTLTFTAKKDLSAAQVASAFASLKNGNVQGSASAQLGIYTSAGGVANKWSSGAVQSVDANNAKVVFSVDNVAPTALNVAKTGTTSIVAAGVKAGTDAVDADPGVLAVTAGKVTIDDAANTVKTISIDSYGAGSTITGGAALETLNLSRSGFTYNATTGAINGAADIVVAKTAATAALNLTGVGSSSIAAAVTLTAAPTTLNVKSTGANNVALTAAATKTLNVSGTGKLTTSAGDLSALETVKVTESAGLALYATTANTITSIDTTGTTGAVSAYIKGDKATYTGGAGADTVTVVNADTAISKAINLGAGNDRLDLSNAGAVDAVVPTALLNGGDGTDTIVLTANAGQTLSGDEVFQKKFTSFEKLEINAVSADKTVNMHNMNDINYVINAGTAGANTLTFDKMVANSTVELKGASKTIVNLADASGSADVLNVVTNAATLGALTANSIETIKFTVNNTGTSSAVSTHILTLDANSATNVTIGGAGNFTLSLSDATQSVAMIDGSASTGKLNITTSSKDGNLATTVKAGSGAATLTAKGTGDILIGGAGADTLKVVSNADSAASAVTLTGGAGIDTFDLSGFKAANAGAAVTITDLEKGEVIKFVASSTADFVSSKVTLIAEATFDNYVTEAIKAADIAANARFVGVDPSGINGTGGLAWFQFGGNTFIVQDVDGNGSFTNGTDIIVKLVGLIDLSASSFNDATLGGLKFL